MTARQCVCDLVNGERHGIVPFTIYDKMLPRGTEERLLRDNGLLLVKRVPLFTARYKNVEVLNQPFSSDHKKCLHRILRTPLGDLSMTQEQVPCFQEVWTTTEYYIRNRRDYEVMEYVIQDTDFEPNYEEFRYWENHLAEDGYVIGNIPDYVYSPMNYMMYNLLGIERFCIDQYDSPDPFYSLYHSIWKKQQMMMPLIPSAPGDLLIYDGNIYPGTISPSVFQKYYSPCINSFARVVHDAGKHLAIHYDAKVGTLLDSIGSLEVDTIEAFTPVPTGDITIEKAFSEWPGKLLWINFPSSVFVDSEEAIEIQTQGLLDESKADNGLIIGITEDMPETFPVERLGAILRILKRSGRFPAE